MVGALTERWLWTRPVILRRVRQMDVDGRVLVGERASVRPGDLLAHAQRSLPPTVIPAARVLGLVDPSLDRCMVRRPGDVVREGEVLAQRGGVLGIGSRVCRSPVSGTLQMGPRGSGELLVTPPPEEVELRAHLPGRVVSILPLRGVVVELAAMGAQGVAGRPGEAGGRIRVLSGPDQEIPANRVTDRLSATVLVGGTIGLTSLRRAVEVGVGAVVVGSLRAAALEAHLADPRGVPLVVIDSFGPRGMGRRCYEMLRQCEGREARVQVGSGGEDGDLPEVLVPLDDASAARQRRGALVLGALVRIVAGRHAFAVGQVVAVGAGPVRFASGLVGRWVDLLLEDGSQVRVPLVNVELVGSG